MSRCVIWGSPTSGGNSPAMIACLACCTSSAVGLIAAMPVGSCVLAISCDSAIVVYPPLWLITRGRHRCGPVCCSVQTTPHLLPLQPVPAAAVVRGGPPGRSRRATARGPAPRPSASAPAPWLGGHPGAVFATRTVGERAAADRAARPEDVFEARAGQDAQLR